LDTGFLGVRVCIHRGEREKRHPCRIDLKCGGNRKTTIGGDRGQDLLADLAEGAEDGVEVVVGESEVEVTDINSGLGRNQATAASAGGLGGSRGRANKVVFIVIEAAEAPRGLGRGHGYGEAIATSQRQSVCML